MKKAILIGLLALCTIPSTIQAQQREVKLPPKTQQHGYRDYSTQDKGFWCGVEAEGGSSIMINSRNMQYVSLTYTAGYRINEYLRVGVGFGGRVYVNNDQVRDASSPFCMPIVANVRGNFMSSYDRNGVPFWSVNVGAITQEGFFVSPEVGYSFGGLRHNFQIGLSYTLSSLDTTYKKKTQAYSYLGLKLGYEF